MAIKKNTESNPAEQRPERHTLYAGGQNCEFYFNSDFMNDDLRAMQRQVGKSALALVRSLNYHGTDLDGAAWRAQEALPGIETLLDLHQCIEAEIAHRAGGAR